MLPRTFLFLVLVLCLTCVVHGEDLVLTGGSLLDGSGKPAMVGNVRIRDGKIQDVGPFRVLPADKTIDVKGLVVAPGIIDIDNHSAGLLDVDTGASTQILQGITTAVVGLDGEGPIQVEDFMKRFERKSPAMNVMAFAGHNTARREVLGQDYKRAATPDEIRRMEVLVEQAMSQGAFGLSSNLEFGPGAYSTMDEIVALAQIVAKYAGVYAIHLRNEGDKVFEALREAIDVGRRAKVPIHISHLKLGAAAVWGKSTTLIGEIAAARSQGVDVTADASPYESIESDISAAGAAEAPANMLVTRAFKHPEYSFKTLAQLAAEKSMSPVDAVQQIVRDGGARVIVTSMSPSDVRAFASDPSIMIASDGGLGYLHPSGAGAFPRVLGPMARDEKSIKLETAIRKMTAMPAARLGLKERGVLQKGAAADILVFDPARIQDRATVQNPSAPAEGVKYVFVNGIMVVSEGQPTADRPGTPLR